MVNKNMKTINPTGFIAILVLLLGCVRSEKGAVLTRKGFLIYHNMEFWYFVPTETLNSDNCIPNFNAKNFAKGLQLSPNVIPNLSFIKRSFDSISGEAYESRYLQISPVEVQFRFSPEYQELFTSNSADPGWNFRFEAVVDGEPVTFIYNNFPVKIIRVDPLFCYQKKETEISECPCYHRENDPDDYLFKICNYIKSNDRYSDLPCRYRIKEISSDTQSGKAVTKVELTCCFLGDVAYFDPSSKELISISYGAR